jgi:proline iminopeptidase
MTQSHTHRRRGLIWSSFVAIVVIAGLTYGGWTMFNRPLYLPGMVSASDGLRAPLEPPAQPEDGEFWQVEDDIELYHFSTGSGRNVLVIHGGPGMPYIAPWTGLDPLTDDFTFHFYDQRGAGRSTRPLDEFTSSNTWTNMQTLDQTLGLGAQLADIERIRRILGDDELIIVGHSFGAFQAALYAAEFPNHVAALVLIAPADMLVMPGGGGLFESVRERLPEDQWDDYDAYMARYLDFGNLFSRTEADLIALNAEFGVYYQTAIGVELVEQGDPGGWMTMAQYVSMGRRHDYRAALERITAPTLILHGADDLQPIDVANTYAERIPNATVTVIEDSTHFPFEEQPEVFATVIGDFLAEIEG